jgi:hypothetical protein
MYSSLGEPMPCQLAGMGSPLHLPALLNGCGGRAGLTVRRL